VANHRQSQEGAEDVICTACKRNPLIVNLKEALRLKEEKS